MTKTYGTHEHDDASEAILAAASVEPEWAAEVLGRARQQQPKVVFRVFQEALYELLASHQLQLTDGLQVHKPERR